MNQVSLAKAMAELAKKVKVAEMGQVELERVQEMLGPIQEQILEQAVVRLLMARNLRRISQQLVNQSFHGSLVDLC